MKARISIPATLDNRCVVRCFTCYPHQIDRYPVNTDDYFTDVVVNENFDFRDTTQVVDALRKWFVTAEMRGNLLVLAYQGIQVSEIVDDRSQWHHDSLTSHRDDEVVSEKVFVYESAATRVISLNDLKQDAQFVKDQSKLKSELRDEQAFSERHLNIYTADVIDDLIDNRDVQPNDAILKLGGATYVLLRDGVLWKPEEGLTELNMNKNKSFYGS